MSTTHLTDPTLQMTAPMGAPSPAESAPTHPAQFSQPTHPRYQQPQQPQQPQQATPASALGITSFVLGLVSVVSGWLFFVPLLGLIFGIIARRRDEANRTLTIWGIALNSVLLGIWMLFALISLAMLGAAILSIPFWA